MKTVAAFAVLALCLVAANAAKSPKSCDAVAVCKEDPTCGGCPYGSVCRSFNREVCRDVKTKREICGEPVPICRPILTECGTTQCKYDEKCVKGAVCEDVPVVKKGYSGYYKKTTVQKCSPTFTCEKVADPKKCEVVTQLVCEDVKRPGSYKGRYSTQRVCNKVNVQQCEPFKNVTCGAVTCAIGDECKKIAPCETREVVETICQTQKQGACVQLSRGEDWGPRCGSGFCKAGQVCSVTCQPSTFGSSGSKKKSGNSPGSGSGPSGPGGPSGPPGNNGTNNSTGVPPSANTTSLSFANPGNVITATTADSAGDGNATSLGLSQIPGAASLSGSGANAAGTNVVTLAQTAGALVNALSAAAGTNNAGK